MSLNKVFICGKVINPKLHADLFGDVLLDLPSSKNNFIFYVMFRVPNEDPFEDNTDEYKAVACRFTDKDKYNNFKSNFDTNNNIYLIGYLSSNTVRNYKNYIIVQDYRKVPDSCTNKNIVLISGKVTDQSSNSFVSVTANKETIDVYKYYGTDDSKQLEPGNYIDMMGYIRLSNYIKEPFNTDNAVFAKKVFDESSESESDKSKDDDSKFRLLLEKCHNNFIVGGNLEDKFLLNFKEISKCNRFSYSFEDVLNFYTSMKNSGLVILSGPSGTGKTELVRCYAEALGLLKPDNKKDHHSQYLHISVSPSWTDDTDLLGYYNVNKHKYYPSNTGLVNLLYKASRNKNKLYVVLLDEMNLSRIEYYFSQFLSILELPENDPNRCIKLYDRSFANSNDDIPNSIPIYNNVLFVGTVNIDESTKQITDKVLDRSNLIKINSSKFTSGLFKSKDSKKLNKLLNKIDPITVSQFYSLKKESKNNSLSNKTDVSSKRRQVLTYLNKLIMMTTYGKREIGYREVKQINEYLCDLPNNDDPFVKDIMNKHNNSYKNYSDMAFDYQLSQRILDKLSGSKYELGNYISSLCDCMCGSHHFDDHNTLLNGDELNSVNIIKKKLTDLFTNYIPHNYSSIVIRRKWMELHYYGFTR